VKQPGVLYVVATPIGNLEDMTFRAVRVLREADWIAAEDTRRTRALLAHFGVAGKRLVSYREQNREKAGAELICRLAEGQSVALVSDAGTPGISDPGEHLVRLAVASGIPVVPVPGANAAVAALSASGLSTSRFLFVGFLPRRGRKLAESLAELASVPATLVFFEAPHRLEETLRRMLETFGDRRIAVARELTKLHEQFFRGTIREALDELAKRPPQGEYVLVVEGAKSFGDDGPAARKSAGAEGRRSADDGRGLAERVLELERELGDRKRALKQAAEEFGVSRREAYAARLMARGGLQKATHGETGNDEGASD